jgi:hypothetical protein
VTGRQNMELAERLASEWEANAVGVREIDADRDYSNYWRGYAVALESCARVLRARGAQKEG